jgi:tripartite-type tricarboxylate transporter receptor subunit TctC
MYLLPMVEAKPSFDHAKDFVPVSLLGRFEFAVVTGPATGREGFRRSSSPGSGQSGESLVRRAEQRHIPHFARTRLEAALGIPMTRVPYRGGAAVVKDLVGGHLPFAVVTVSDAVVATSGRRGAHPRISSPKRSPFVPEVPTLRECGVDLVADSWYGMWLPAG